MISLVILSHSPKIAEGVMDLAQEMVGEAPIYAVGGTNAGTLGADFDATFQVLDESSIAGDVIVLADMGSTRMTAQMAIEALSAEQQARITLSNAAVVEGAVVAAVSIGGGLSCEMVLEQLQEFELNKD